MLESERHSERQQFYSDLYGLQRPLEELLYEVGASARHPFPDERAEHPRQASLTMFCPGKAKVLDHLFMELDNLRKSGFWLQPNVIDNFDTWPIWDQPTTEDILERIEELWWHKFEMPNWTTFVVQRVFLKDPCQVVIGDTQPKEQNKVLVIYKMSTRVRGDRKSVV